MSRVLGTVRSKVKPCKKNIKNASRTVKGSQHGSRPKNQFKINVKCLDPWMRQCSTSLGAVCIASYGMTVDVERRFLFLKPHEDNSCQLLGFIPTPTPWWIYSSEPKYNSFCMSFIFFGNCELFKNTSYKISSLYLCCSLHAEGCFNTARTVRPVVQEGKLFEMWRF